MHAENSAAASLKLVLELLLEVCVCVLILQLALLQRLLSMLLLISSWRFSLILNKRLIECFVVCGKHARNFLRHFGKILKRNAVVLVLQRHRGAHHAERRAHFRAFLHFGRC